MHHCQLATDFLIHHYKLNQADKISLNSIFEAYKDPSNTQTQIPDQRTAAAYFIARGLSIAGVLQHLISQNLSFFKNINNIVDFGGGPGTFLWSLLDYIQPESYHNIDTNRHLLSIFDQISNYLNLQQTKGFRQNYFTFKKPFDSNYDLAVFSYTLCENPQALDAVNMTIGLSNSILIIEPGTPLGFENILKARQLLIQKEYQILAPCSHTQTCPLEKSLEDKSDWCHFVIRNMRHKTQMFLKSADKGYEDEKYIYLLASKTQIKETDSTCRIISKPQLKPHLIEFNVCTPDSPARIEIYKKSQKQEFKQYKKAKRGDLYTEV